MPKNIIPTIGLILLAATGSGAEAQNFYAGKQLTVLVNYEVGGPTDIEARAFTRHIGKHIPGNPTIQDVHRGLHQARRRTEVGTMYLFFDTETTGLPRDYNAPTSDVDNWPRVVQIAWVVADDTGKELRVQSDIIRPDGFEMLEQLHKKLFDTKLKISHEAVADVRSCVKCFFELKLRGVV